MKVFVSRDEEVREIENTKFNESKKKKKKNSKRKKSCMRARNIWRAKYE